MSDRRPRRAACSLVSAISRQAWIIASHKCGAERTSRPRPVVRTTAPEIGGGGLLTHFTRASHAGDALDNLVEILRDGVVKGSGRMILGKRPTVCLFDAPIAELRRLLTRANRHRYQPFGVAIDKRYAFARGVRPVIYMPLVEARRMLAEEELWRVVALDPSRNPPIDWTFEREWRVRDQLGFPARAAVAFVENCRDVDDIPDPFHAATPWPG